MATLEHEQLSSKLSVTYATPAVSGKFATEPVEISRNVADNAHAVLIMDQAGWHMSNNLVVPRNITIMPLPPKSPVLNPVGNLWQFMRDNWLSNRVFKSYEDIVDHCCYAWRTLQDRPWKIMSIGRRQWAQGF